MVNRYGQVKRRYDDASLEAVRLALVAACEAAGSQRKWAMDNNVHASAVNCIIKGKLTPTVPVAQLLDFELICKFVPRNGTGATLGLSNVAPVGVSPPPSLKSLDC